MSVRKSERKSPGDLKRRSGERRRADRRSSVQTSDEAVAAQLRARQQMAVMRHVPASIATALASTLLIAAYPGTGIVGTALVPWLIGVVMLLLLHLQSWSQWRKRGRSKAASVRNIQFITAHAGVFGVAWASVPGLMLAQADGHPYSLLAASLTAMLCIGGVTLAAIPSAAYAYLGGLCATLLVTQIVQPGAVPGLSAVLWVGCLAVMVSGIWMVSRTLEARVQAEISAKHQGQLVGLLLRDFEEQGSDLLWEIDECGQLAQVSSRLAEALGRPKGELEGRPLFTLLTELQHGLSEADRDAAQALHLCLTKGQPFRDVLVPLTLGGKLCWWSLTAKPLVNERGSAIGWRGVARDVTQARTADKRMTWLAHYDTLTGLTNRAHFRVLLEQAVQRGPNRQGGAVMCLDMDGFKNVNDTLGHATGDALLQEVARRLKSAVAKDDVVGRLGGDEFAVLLNNTVEKEKIEATAQRIIDAMQEPCDALGAQVHVRLSLGIARFPDDGISVDQLMQHADLALYDAKSNAPGTARFFVRHMGEQIRRRLVLERDLREALEKGQLSLHYQPKVDLARWEVTGFEALLRWNHPEHGNIPPTEFITVAEESGLILAMGEWALTQACMQAARWPGDIQVAVNISPVQVMAQNLPDTVQRALFLSGLEAGRLELEITESVFINEDRGTVGRLHALRKLGAQIALDDFGTGYSSLAYLRRFPFDTLKIDRAFVRELLISRDARSIVRNILALAKALRMSTVAEGVEEPAHVTVLNDEGCDLVQGYFVSRPMPADEVMPFLRSWKKRPRPVPPRDFKLANTEISKLADATQMAVEA